MSRRGLGVVKSSAGVAARQLVRARMASATAFKEVCLPVPWGHVAGKAWGDPANKPVLALHGWMDNAGSFDRLAPLLATNAYVVAMDFPGHGLSSHRPAGLLYDSVQYVTDIKHMVDALKWEKFNIVAHSMGAAAASWFAGAMPEAVERLVLIEGLGLWTFDEVKSDPSNSSGTEKIPLHFGNALGNLHKLDYVDNKTYPTWDAAVDRMMLGHTSLDESFREERSCAEVLCVRGTRRLDDGTYQFTRDVRLNLPSALRMSRDINMTFLKAVECPTLLVLADHQTEWHGRIADSLNEIVSQVKDKIQVVKVSGGHHVHMYAPERVVGHIAPFLNASQSKL